MTVLNAILIMLLYGGLAFSEWKRGRGVSRRGNLLLLGLYAAVCACSLIVLAAPRTPGPTQWISAVLRPLGQLLEKG